MILFESREGVQEQVKKDISKSQQLSTEITAKPEIVSYQSDDDYDYDYYSQKGNSDGDDYLSDEEIENDVDDLKSSTLNRKPKDKLAIESLPLVDHGSVKYHSFHSTFYKVHSMVSAKTDDDIKRERHDLDISIIGSTNNQNIPCPVKSFEHLFHFDIQLLHEIQRQGFKQPTPIQSQTIPIILSGRNCIALSSTGSGKTLAYLWPAIIHVKGNKSIKTSKDGMIALILAPTRELVLQIHQVGFEHHILINVHSSSC